jgi:hypothetical protein
MIAFTALSIVAGIAAIVFTLYVGDGLSDDPARAALMQVGFLVSGAISVLGSAYVLISTRAFAVWNALPGWQKALALLVMIPGLLAAGALWILWMSVSNKRRR